MGRLDEKKKKKREDLLHAAYELFTSKGVFDTSISDIVKKANMAKGTFYLYFKDKYDMTPGKYRLQLEKRTSKI